MFRNKIYNVVILACVVIIIFDISYFASINKYHKLQSSGAQTNDYNTYPANFERPVINNTTKDKIVLKDSNMVFIIRNSKTNWNYVADTEKVPAELVGKKWSEVENLYLSNGYKLDSVTPENAVFLKEVEGYPYRRNKYVLGISDGYMALYKIDNEGNMSKIEMNSEKKVQDLPKDFQELLLKGDSSFEFDSENDAKEYFNGCAS